MRHELFGVRRERAKSVPLGSLSFKRAIVKTCYSRQKFELTFYRATGNKHAECYERFPAALTIYNIAVFLAFKAISTRTREKMRRQILAVSWQGKYIYHKKFLLNMVDRILSNWRIITSYRAQRDLRDRAYAQHIC